MTRCHFRRTGSEDECFRQLLKAELQCGPSPPYIPRAVQLGLRACWCMAQLQEGCGGVVTAEQGPGGLAVCSTPTVLPIGVGQDRWQGEWWSIVLLCWGSSGERET